MPTVAPTLVVTLRTARPKVAVQPPGSRGSGYPSSTIVSSRFASRSISDAWIENRVEKIHR